jgi:hypothetical protein
MRAFAALILHLGSSLDEPGVVVPASTPGDRLSLPDTLGKGARSHQEFVPLRSKRLPAEASYSLDLPDLVLQRAPRRRSRWTRQLRDELEAQDACALSTAVARQEPHQPAGWLFGADQSAGALPLMNHHDPSRSRHKMLRDLSMTVENGRRALGKANPGNCTGDKVTG